MQDAKDAEPETVELPHEPAPSTGPGIGPTHEPVDPPTVEDEQTAPATPGRVGAA